QPTSELANPTITVMATTLRTDRRPLCVIGPPVGRTVVASLTPTQWTRTRARRRVDRSAAGAHPSDECGERGASQEVSLPVEDHADLPAEAGSLLIEDAAAHAEPPALEEGGPEPGWTGVDGEVVLPLVRRARPRFGIDGIPARGEVDGGAEPLGDQLREVVDRPEQYGLLVGAVEVPVHHQGVVRGVAPGGLDGVPRAGDREGGGEGQLPVERLDPHGSVLRAPVPRRRVGHELVAHRALVRELGAEAELPGLSGGPGVAPLQVDRVKRIDPVLPRGVDAQPRHGRRPNPAQDDAVVA